MVKKIELSEDNFYKKESYKKYQKTQEAVDYLRKTLAQQISSKSLAKDLTREEFYAQKGDEVIQDSIKIISSIIAFVLSSYEMCHELYEDLGNLGKKEKSCKCPDGHESEKLKEFWASESGKFND